MKRKINKGKNKRKASQKKKVKILTMKVLSEILGLNDEKVKIENDNGEINKQKNNVPGNTKNFELSLSNNKENSKIFENQYIEDIKNQDCEIPKKYVINNELKLNGLIDKNYLLQ